MIKELGQENDVISGHSKFAKSVRRFTDPLIWTVHPKSSHNNRTPTRARKAKQSIHLECDVSRRTGQDIRINQRRDNSDVL